MKNKKINITLLMGGPSSEREVSLETGKVILNALDKNKYNVRPIIVSKQGKGLDKIAKIKTDVAFIAMHGEFGEDGTAQGFLEALGIPYTGSGILASSLGMDKIKSSSLFRDCGLLVPDFTIVNKSEWLKNELAVLRNLMKKFKFPLVIKPANRGSSVGITIVENEKILGKAIRKAFEYSEVIQAQKYVKGRELTCGVIDDGKDKAMPLPPIEIVPRATSFYGYEDKYKAGGSDHFIPPRNMPPALIKKIRDTALKTHKIIGCSGMSRTDMILGGDGKLYVLEINTIPGMTETSLLPQAAAAAGISFPDLLDKIIQAALNKRKSL